MKKEKVFSQFSFIVVISDNGNLFYFYDTHENVFLKTSL